MSEVYFAVGLALLFSVAVGLYRVVRGPGLANRMTAVQLVGTAGLATVLLLGTALDIAAATDIGIVFALLAALAVTAFVRCLHDLAPGPDGEGLPEEIER